MPEYADTEVSTNLAVSVDGELPQDLEMTFALYGECVSNCLQVAFGRDSDGDGILGADGTSRRTYPRESVSRKRRTSAVRPQACSR